MTLSADDGMRFFACSRRLTWSLLAIDGDVTADVSGQIDGLPAEATHLVVSVGGNDALGCISVLDSNVSTVRQALAILSRVRHDFRADYRNMIEQLRRLKLPVAVCTIYKDIPDLPDEEKSALALFNEVITDEAARAGFPMIDLRQVCSDPMDYSDASPIEPSHSGGRKIAKAILATIDCRC